jgi:hypothetical protein
MSKSLTLLLLLAMNTLGCVRPGYYGPYGPYAPYGPYGYYGHHPIRKNYDKSIKTPRRPPCQMPLRHPSAFRPALKTKRR